MTGVRAAWTSPSPAAASDGGGASALLAVAVDDNNGNDCCAPPFPVWGFLSPPLEAGCGGSGLSRHVRRRLQLLHKAISNLVVWFEGLMSRRMASHKTRKMIRCYPNRIYLFVSQ